MKKFLSLTFLLILAASFGQAEMPTVQEKVLCMKEYPGYFPFYWDEEAGKIWLKIDKFDFEFYST